MNLDQGFIVLGSRSFDVFELKNIRRAVFRAYNRFHGCSSKIASIARDGHVSRSSPI